VTVADEHTDSTAWWQKVHDHTDAPLSDLIDGFDTIASQAIPYGCLPSRARTFYGSEYTTWAQLANETIRTLLDRRKVGIRTVRAIVIAARDAVTQARFAPANAHADSATGIDRMRVPASK
jgi:hypothetical protein